MSERQRLAVWQCVSQHSQAIPYFVWVSDVEVHPKGSSAAQRLPCQMVPWWLPADGQWLFLHPLNSRMLLQHFGAYASCPPTVTAKVGRRRLMLRWAIARPPGRNVVSLSAGDAYLAPAHYV